MRNKLPVIVFVVMIQFMAFAALSQNGCGASSLDIAQQNYDIGKLTECITVLQTCLYQKGFSTSQQVRAYKLMAMSYLALDKKQSADSAIQDILYRQPDFAADDTDPNRFRNELLYMLARQGSITVSSVSKRPEDIRLAPATTYVITQEEILQRGYTDLIDVLKDIPGFDITVYYGQTYANVYQRGFRTTNTDKTLLLIDGIEDNDIWSNFADISQQYPVTNIKQVEVVYGPSSTMYGPNAFSGVINVITKSAGDYLHKNRPFGLQFQAGAGSYGTKYAELTAAYKKGIVSLTVTGRLYYSDRPDLSSDTLFDYDPKAYSARSPQTNDTLYMRRFRRANGPAYLDSNHIFDYPGKDSSTFFYLDPNGLFTLVYDSITHLPAALNLTDSGVRIARRLDSLAYISKAYSRFRNKAKDLYLSAKLAVGNFSFGIVSWSKEEGAGTTFTDRVFSVNGSSWKPQHYYVYAGYSQPLSNMLNLSISANYRVHRIADGSKLTSLNSYLKGFRDLEDLENRVPVSLRSVYYFEQSNQFRSEVKLIYNKGKNLGFVSGLELRNGMFQKYYITDTASHPQVTGRSGGNAGNNFYTVKDIGVYFQGTVRTNSGWGLTAGARLDNNIIEEAKGLGTTVTPRLVADYSRKDWVIKAIYSSGIQNISNYTRFDDIIAVRDTSVSRTVLQPEKIHNYELSVSKRFSKKVMAATDGFFSDIDNVVGAIVNGPTKKNDNIGEFRIWGIQSNLFYRIKNLQLTLNHTYTRPTQTKGVFTRPVHDTVKTSLVNTDKAVADIATHKLNLTVNYRFLRRCDLNLRLNYVGSKKIGPATSVPNNLLLPHDSTAAFPGYFLANASFTVNHLLGLRGASLQFNCNNLLDKTYYSPGIRASGGLNYPNQIRQMGRNISLKFTYEL